MTTDPVPLGESAPRDLIVTLFGLYSRGENNWLPVSALVRLMEELGIDGPAVRSSVSRLKRRGVLLGVRREATAGYELSPATLQVLTEGDTRIFRRVRSTLADGWLLLTFSIPESERDKRHALRTALSGLGFGTVSPGVWIAPAALESETKTMLDRKGLRDYVELFAGHHLGFEDLRSRVQRWWDLDQITLSYADFVRRHRRLTSVDVADAAAAFAAYVPMLTAWRVLPYLDPGLPLEVLPAGWNGQVAEELFGELNDRLSAPAREFALDVLHGSAASGPLTTR
ncbi:PaaX family transcriptional regulator C-terminal domain-containing protein [Williamsia sp. CHRR-6]|uniref:PaaX family transcriptional regulator n=1 Tax=Williamsia sp. CHRR-6 TaxID=2835871 RepID=UPI001BD98393|nr:PaaX family transcriptional regulator C-terminal domain-containing protein [Williamsia sp. CHRR-6]MBT0567570.1 PaaX family transcriptional regulator [Williamsia sp. CHRR-6]